MHFVRKITNSDALKHIVDLPESLLHQEVELIILPLDEYASVRETVPATPTARGALKQYANLNLIQYEQSAWEKSVQEKDEYR